MLEVDEEGVEAAVLGKLDHRWVCDEPDSKGLKMRR